MLESPVDEGGLGFWRLEAANNQRRGGRASVELVIWRLTPRQTDLWRDSPGNRERGTRFPLVREWSAKFADGAR
jgi:hypothetical protein